MPVPGKTTLKYGGNTSSILVEVDGMNLYFDAGSGLSVERSTDEINILRASSRNAYHLFLSHLHYDHMMGFPFFRPFFDRDAEVDIYGPQPDQMGSLEYALNQFLRAPFMPFNIGSYKAQIQIHQLAPSEIVRLSENVSVRTFELQHPNGCFAYKVEQKSSSDGEAEHFPVCGKRFVYATDTTDFIGKKRQDFLHFIENADLLVLDAFFDDDEMNGVGDGIDKRGWGHCSWEQAVTLAEEGHVKKLALFHHLHTRTDDELDEIQRQARMRLAGAFCAYDGCLVEI